jgi:hypothetical protein
VGVRRLPQPAEGDFPAQPEAAGADPGPALDRLVFVGGAPRSGTTLTHALICSAPEVVDYHPEIIFFRSIPEAYRRGLSGWQEHTSAFFPDQEAFRRLMRDTAIGWLRQTAEGLSARGMLCLKDPLLTPHFPAVHELLPEARFVTVCRHPFSVVRSRQDVHEKSHPDTPFSAAQVSTVAQEYAIYYTNLINSQFHGRHVMFRYEDIQKDHVRTALAEFIGVGGFDEEALWRTPPEAGWGRFTGNPWDSPKFRAPIQMDPRLSALDPAWQAIVRELCAPLMQRMGYV